MKKLMLILLASTNFSAQYNVPLVTGANRGPASTIFTITNSQYGNGGSGSLTSVNLPAFSASLTNPSLIMVLEFGGSSGTFTAPTDTASNTFVDCGPGQGNITGTQIFECWYALNTHTTASDVVTLHTAGGVTFLQGVAFELTGANTSTPIDIYGATNSQTSGPAGANNHTAGSITPTHNGDMIVAQFADGNGTTVGTSPNAFTTIAATGGFAEYYIQPTAGAISATASGTVNSSPFGSLTVAIRH